MDEDLLKENEKVNFIPNLEGGYHAIPLPQDVLAQEIVREENKVSELQSVINVASEMETISTESQDNKSYEIASPPEVIGIESFKSLEKENQDNILNIITDVDKLNTILADYTSKEVNLVNRVSNLQDSITSTNKQIQLSLTDLEKVRGIINTVNSIKENLLVKKGN